MNYDYCKSCGSKVEYLLQKPNFCPACGIDLRGSSPPRTASPVAVAARKEIDDPEGTDIFQMPSIGKLQYTVDSDYGAIGTRRIKLGDVLGTNVEPENPEEAPKEQTKKNSGKPLKKSTPSKPVTMKEKFEAVKGTMEECKSSQNNIVDVGEEG